jgi:hypothetical protein
VTAPPPWNRRAKALFVLSRNGYTSGMKRAFSLLGISLLFVVTGCVSTQPKVIGVAYDQGDLERVQKAKTYHWSLPNSSSLNPYNNQDVYLNLVKSDIDTELAKKGYQLVPSGGGLEVSFLMVYKTGADTSVIDQYFGTNRKPEHHIVKAINSVPTPSHYEIGTLVVDAEDARDHESLWRGAVSSHVNRDKPYETQKLRINRAVALVMAGFPKAK